MGLFPQWEAEHATDAAPLPERIRLMHVMHGVTPGKTCKDCIHLLRRGTDAFTKQFLKCELSRITHGAGTDWRARWLACGKYQEEANSGDSSS